MYVLRPGLDDDEVMPVALMAFAIAVMAWRCSCCGLGGSAGWVRDFAGALLVLSQGASAVDHFMRKLPQPAGELLITCSYWLALALITDTEFLTPLPQKKGKAATKATKQA